MPGADFDIYNLQYLDLAKNQISTVPDMSSHRFLMNLSLDCKFKDNSANYIEDISGISQCFHLKNLSISGNKISKIDCLEKLPLKTLNIVFDYLSVE